MAEYRMFSKKVVESDAFVNLPLTAQALYFHIGMRAKDKGLLNNIFAIARSVMCTAEDIGHLYDAGFIKPINSDDGICREWEIVHWYENNGIGETAKKRNNYKYRQWRSEVIERDAVCMHCGSSEKLQAHHIKSFADFPLLRTDLNNGITLCETCHKKIHKRRCKNG